MRSVVRGGVGEAQVYDNPVLGMWVHELRKKAKEKKMDDETYSRLDAIGFCWTVDQQSAKWHHILHEARRYRVRPTLAHAILCPVMPCYVM